MAETESASVIIARVETVPSADLWCANTRNRNEARLGDAGRRKARRVRARSRGAWWCEARMLKRFQNYGEAVPGEPWQVEARRGEDALSISDSGWARRCMASRGNARRRPAWSGPAAHGEDALVGFLGLRRGMALPS